jgi:hypothetical protein
VLLGARGRGAVDERRLQDVAAFNEYHRQVKAGWSLRRVERDYASTRDELVEVIRAMGRGPLAREDPSRARTVGAGPRAGKGAQRRRVRLLRARFCSRTRP